MVIAEALKEIQGSNLILYQSESVSIHISAKSYSYSAVHPFFPVSTLSGVSKAWFLSFGSTQMTGFSPNSKREKLLAIYKTGQSLVILLSYSLADLHRRKVLRT